MIIGILGGGQLGRMLALAGAPLGFRFRLLEPSAQAPAAHVAECIQGPWDDLSLLENTFRDVDVVTYESENVPVAAVRHLEQSVPVHPGRWALEMTQDRLHEKRLLRRLGIPTAAFDSIDDLHQLRSAIQRVGLPCVLKTRRFGYDGKGQFLLRREEDLERAWAALGGVSLILEEFVHWQREVSLIAARDLQGRIQFYPLVENHHVEGILRVTRAPAPGLTPELQKLAQLFTTRILEELEYVGVMAVEYFQRGETLIVNEIAPRVHNTGHWTIEGAETSQFENHIRAICGLPLGTTATLGHCVMVNLIGELPAPSQVLDIPGAHLHLYGKSQRPGRKLGHVTLRHSDPSTLEAHWSQLQAALQGPFSDRTL